jgi:holliday junction DNA helicase ruvA
MFNYIKGKVVDQESNYIVVESNNIGFQIHVANPYSYELGSNEQIFLYNHIREEEYTLYGFKNKEEKELFLRLINVKGLGPKMALPMLATGSVSGIIDAIDRENVLYLTKFPKIGEKIARQIILDLKGKLAANLQAENNSTNDELIDVLTSLGYKNSDIKKVIKSIDSSLPIELQVKEALKLLLK